MRARWAPISAGRSSAGGFSATRRSTPAARAGSSLDAQLEFNRRIAGKQVRLEQDLKAIRESQQEDRQHSADETDALKERLARLEALIGKDGQPES